MENNKTKLKIEEEGKIRSTSKLWRKIEEARAERKKIIEMEDEDGKKLTIYTDDNLLMWDPEYY